MSEVIVDTLKHSGNSGTANVTLASSGAVTTADDLTVGDNLVATKQNGCQRIVLEQFFCPCDGSVIALQDGNHTITDVTAQQDGPADWTDCNGSSITYTPPSGTKQVIYEYRVCWGYSGASCIAHFRLMVDSDEVTSGRHQFMNYQYPTYYESVKWGFNIGDTADTTVGRLASWTSDKTIKVQWRRYSVGQTSRLHNLQHWDQAGANLIVKPQLAITAIG